jgi:3-hydroxyacyl-CoA dehydrogenase
MLSARRAEALSLVDEGAMPWDVDRVLEQFGMPMGPFAMTDLAGLDIGWSPETSRGGTVLRDRLCELGRRGQKTGAGYYNYDPETRKRSIDPTVQQLVVEYTARTGRARRDISDTEILERCLYAAVNEGARILEEGIAMRASDIDVIWVHGYGWPAQHGGPMYWADGIGLATILSSVEGYEQRLGEHWRPASLLRRLAARNACFTR